MFETCRQSSFSLPAIMLGQRAQAMCGIDAADRHELSRADQSKGVVGW